MLQAEAAPGVHRVEDDNTNWYIVEGDGGLTIVDAGVPRSWASLHDALRRLGRRSADIRAVVLTHAHFDHVGFAERARRELAVPVFVHENDVPLTKHPWRYDHERPRALVPRHPVQGAAHRRALPARSGLLAATDPRGHALRGRRRHLPVPGAPRVVPTPGHTLGHCACTSPTETRSSPETPS